MRIAFFMQDTGAVYGAERATLDLACGLREAGCEVGFILIEETRVDLGFRLRRELERRNLAFALLLCAGRFSRAVADGVRKYAETHCPDVIHAVGYKADVHLMLAARKDFRPIRVSTVHGWLERPDWKERLYKWLDCRALKTFDAVIALSRFYAQRLLALGVASTRLAVIPSGLDRHVWPTVEHAGERLPRKVEFTIGTLSRLSWEKNHRMLLDALAMLKKQGRIIRAIVAGEGNEKVALLRHAERLGVAGQINWPGYLSAEEFFPQVDAMALCSRIENLPYSILEAMAWCRPVIATRVGGIPDLVVDGETGWLVPPSDSEALADRILGLASDADRVRKMGCRARARLEANFTLEQSVERHRQLYAQMCLKTSG